MTVRSVTKKRAPPQAYSPTHYTLNHLIGVTVYSRRAKRANWLQHCRPPNPKMTPLDVLRHIRPTTGSAGCSLAREIGLSTSPQLADKQRSRKVRPMRPRQRDAGSLWQNATLLLQVGPTGRNHTRLNTQRTARELL